MGKDCPWAEKELAQGAQCMGFMSAGFRRESALPLGGRAGVPRVSREVSTADIFLEFSIARQKLGPHVCSHRVPQASCAPAAGGENAWFGAGLGFDRRMYAQINA